MTAVNSIAKGRSVLYLECRITENLCLRLGRQPPTVIPDDAAATINKCSKWAVFRLYDVTQNFLV